MPVTILSDKTCVRMRACLIKGIQTLLHITHKRLHEQNCFSSFEDLEFALSTENMTSSNCEALNFNELALFVRLTEKFKNENDTRPARMAMFGIVMILTENSSCTYACKPWEAYTPRWQGSKDALDRMTPEAGRDVLARVADDLIRSVWDACKEYSTEFEAAGLTIEKVD
jgi:hypothetical protein